jgi:tetratricopeptide (TPR) repeat protein
MSYFCFENIRVVDMTDTRTINDRIINVVWKGLMGLMRMEKYASRALLLLMAGLILAGCSRINDGKEHRRHVIAELMDSAEVIMNDDPETAFRFMDSIDSHSISGRERKARYALLYSEAQYKKGIDAADDSLIMIAVRYYSINKNMLNRFRSYYMLGCTYNGLGQLTNAAVALGQAELLSDNLNDEYRLGLLYSQLGDVFFYSFDFRRAEQYYRLAMDNYAKAGKDEHRMHALYDVGGCLLQQKKYESAHSILKEVQEWASIHDDKNFESSCILSSLMCSINLQDLELATTELNEYISLNGQPVNDSYVYSLFATCYLSNGKYSEAKHYIGDGWKHAITKSDSINLWYNESLLDELCGRFDSSLVKYKHSIELQNQNLYNLLDQPILGAQKDYYRNLAETESLRASRNRRTVISLSVIFLSIIVILFLINRSRRLEYQADKSDLMLTIKELRLREDSNNETINRLSSRVNDLFSRPYEELDEIFEKMMETDDLIEVQTKVQDDKKKEAYYYKKVDEFYKHVKEKFDEMISNDNQRELDKIINSTCNNLMKRLEGEKMNLSKQDLLILRLSIVGFSPKTIGRLTNTQYKTVHQQRRRAIQKITNVSEEMAAEVAKVLKMS